MSTQNITLEQSLLIHKHYKLLNSDFRFINQQDKHSPSV